MMDLLSQEAGRDSCGLAKGEGQVQVVQSVEGGEKVVIQSGLVD